MPCRLAFAACLVALALALAGPGAARAQGAGAASHAVRYDSTAAALRTPPPDAFARYADDPAYDYDRAAGTGAPSPWQQVVAWLRDALIEPLRDPKAGPLRRLVLYGLIAAALFFAVTGILRIGPRAVFARRARRDALDLRLDEVTDLAAVDFDARLDDALDAADYRLAVRLLFLRTLQRLADADRIAWTRDKLNQDYVAEVPGALRPAFRRLTRAFEHAWYGDAALDADAFARLRRAFAAFDARLGSPPADDADAAPASTDGPAAGLAAGPAAYVQR